MLVLLWLPMLAVLGIAPAWGAPPKAPFAAAVLPFEDLRYGAGPTWLGNYLAERLERALVRAPQVAVLPPEAAAAWARKLRLSVQQPVTEAELGTLGVSVLVQGSTQAVLGLTEVRLTVRDGRGDLVAPAAGQLRLPLTDAPPAVLLGRLLALLEQALVPGTALREPRLPARWEDVERLYRILAEPLVPGDRAARPERVARLKAWVTHAELGGRVHEALAGLLLEQARLHLPEGAGRQFMLGEALQHATKALADDPLDTRRQALKAELHFFLGQYFEARTEASVARIRNPLESLAFVVLGLEAGLSSGQAAEQLGRALNMDPFLRAEARPPGLAPFQSGVLEDAFQRWEALRKGRATASQGQAGDPQADQLAEAIAHFEARRFEEAQRLFQQLAEREDNDLQPWIYLHRIHIAQGQPGEAVTGLRRLAEENPQEADVLYYLGVALAATEEPALAAESFRKALVERPDDAPSQRGLAAAEMAQSHWPEALNALRAALHATPDDADAWLQMGIVQLRMKNKDGAIGALEQALALQPDLEAARTHLEEARQLAPEATPAPSTPAR